MREIPWIPRKVLFVVGILNVQPDRIVGNLMFIESCVHSQDVLLTPVIPSTLMMADGKERWKWGVSGQFSVLFENGFGIWTEKDKEIEHTGFTYPVCLT